MPRFFLLLIGVAGTLAAMWLMLMLIQFFPLPDAGRLVTAYWQDYMAAGRNDGLYGYWGLVRLLMSEVWVLWLVPIAGVLITTLLVTHPTAHGEMVAYLERLHMLEVSLKEARDRADELAGYWNDTNRKLDELFAGLTEAWLVVDAAKGIRRWNNAALALARRSQPMLEGLEGLGVGDVVPSLLQTPVAAALQRAEQHGAVWQGEVFVERIQQWLVAWVLPLGSEVALVLRDVNHKNRDGAFLQSTERLVRQLVEDSVRPVAVLDADWRYLYVSRKWQDALGLPVGAPLVGQDHRQVVPDFPNNGRVVEQQLRNGEMVGREDERRVVNGVEAVLSWHIRPWQNAEGQLSGYIFTVVDQTEVVRLRQQVTQASERENALAYSDALTGLPNRQLFQDRLNMALAQAYRQLGKVALFFLDLDGFKAVNDTLGHDYGDLLLKQVAERLKGCVRTIDTVARLGGDEFTVILSIRDRADAEQVAAKILETIRAPYDLNGKVADKVGTSIGIALYPQDGTQAAELMKKADHAMYAAKTGGKNAYKFATTELKINV